MLAHLNTCPSEEFVASLGAIYEHSPWVARAVVAQRPFASAEQLHGAMQAAVEAAAQDVQLELMRAHPQLLGKLAPNISLTAHSRHEQASAGLDQCSAEEIDQLDTLNRAYRDRFGFPFIVAVRGLTRADILARMRERLTHSPTQEFATNLAEIARIAQLRLDALLAAPP